MEKKTLGMMIASLRKENGMTQLELAEKMGVTDKAVSKWERGDLQVERTSRQVVDKLKSADVLGKADVRYSATSALPTLSPSCLKWWIRRKSPSTRRWSCPILRRRNRRLFWRLWMRCRLPPHSLRLSV